MRTTARYSYLTAEIKTHTFIYYLLYSLMRRACCRSLLGMFIIYYPLALCSNDCPFKNFLDCRGKFSAEINGSGKYSLFFKIVFKRILLIARFAHSHHCRCSASSFASGFIAHFFCVFYVHSICPFQK